MTATELSVSMQGMSSRQLRDDLARLVAADANCKVEVAWQLRAAPHDTRSLDPTVLVAITTTLGALAGTVVTCLFQLVQDRKRGTIVVITRDGTRIEGPADASPEQLAGYVAKVRELEVAHIHMAGTP
jgi:hypothetical protein